MIRRLCCWDGRGNQRRVSYGCWAMFRRPGIPLLSIRQNSHFSAARLRMNGSPKNANGLRHDCTNADEERRFRLPLRFLLFSFHILLPLFLSRDFFSLYTSYIIYYFCIFFLVFFVCDYISLLYFLFFLSMLLFSLLLLVVSFFMFLSFALYFLSIILMKHVLSCLNCVHVGKC